MATVGIIASPSAGKDVRRLVGNAGSVGDVDKIASIRRAAHGAVEGGATRLVILDDTRHLVLRAVEGLAAAAGVAVEIVDLETIGTGSDSRRAAAAMAELNAGAVVVFGGDGTNRDVAKGWPDVAVMPLAVGTNNVFPSTVEPTIGGVAAGLVASGAVQLADVAHRAKRIEVTIDDHHDAALVDVVLVRGDFIGSRAVWHAEDLVAAVFAMAESDSVGLSSIAGVMAPVGRCEAAAVTVTMGPGGSIVRAPIGPGTYVDVEVESHRRLELGEPFELAGPGVLAFDGERDHVLSRGAVARVTVTATGPWVIDPARALAAAVADQFFVTAAP
jgi:predicted polyphosphate/ATP-dependent NAD kinase